MNHTAIQQIDYHAWANQRFFDHLSALPTETFTQTVQSVFPSIQEALIHIYQVDILWLSVMSGDTFDQTMAIINEHEAKSAGTSLDQLRELYNEAEQSYRTHLSRTDDPDASITIHHPQYGSMETSISELIHHVVNHGTYHRGNITAMLRQMGHTGISSDYIFFLHDRNQPTQ